MFSEWSANLQAFIFEDFMPATGEQIHKAADKVVKMTIAKALKDSVNKVAVLADGGGRVTCRSVVVRDTIPGATSATGTIGRSFYVLDGGSVEVLRGVLERNMEVGILVSGIDSTAMLEVARETFDRAGLSGREHAYAFELSAGQQRRVGIARALAKADKDAESPCATRAFSPATAA